MRDNRKRRATYARRRQLFDQLKLQADILCESHDEKRESIIMSRMMNIILGMTKGRLNAATKQALVDHFVDCAQPGDPTVELGGTFDRDSLYVNGSFRLSDLARRIVWTQSRTATTIDNTY